MTTKRGVGFAIGLLLGLPGVVRAQADSAFDHPQHAKVFLYCTTCHAGAKDSTQRIWPASSGCAECHDGQVEKRVTWNPPTALRPNNLKFSHAGHEASSGLKGGADSTLSCQACHADAGARWMNVKGPIVANCFSCHGLKSVAHLEAPDTACMNCHVPLTEAAGLTTAQIARFPAPASHLSPSLSEAGGHGRQAQGVRVAGRRLAVAPSCTVCHAQEFCATCHLDAPRIKAIQAMGRDPRSLALASKGHRPGWHGQDFSETHASMASAKPATCATCHQRADCLDCHRPNPGNGRATYHQTGYLVKHPAEAYSRASECSQCHNEGYFCASCHKQSGLVATGPLTGGYHNSAQFFALGHGKAARQSLESCVSCHTENDCLRCHSATQGRHFNPHGPGFDASKLKSRNPQMCGACHGPNIPG